MNPGCLLANQRRGTMHINNTIYPKRPLRFMGNKASFSLINKNHIAVMVPAAVSDLKTFFRVLLRPREELSVIGEMS